MTDFFVLRSPQPGSLAEQSFGTVATRALGYNVGDAPRCALCHRPVGAREWLPPFQIDLQFFGQRVADLIIDATGDAILASASFKKMLEESQLNGAYDFQTVEICQLHGARKLKYPIPAFFRASVRRNDAVVDATSSRMEFEFPERRCGECLLGDASLVRLQRVVLSSSKDIREDLFIPRGLNVFMASADLRRAFIAHGLVGVEFVPAANFALDFWPTQTTLLCTNLAILDDTTMSRSRRQDAYRTIAAIMGQTPNDNQLFVKSFDPDQDIDAALLAAARLRAIH